MKVFFSIHDAIHREVISPRSQATCASQGYISYVCKHDSRQQYERPVPASQSAKSANKREEAGAVRSDRRTHQESVQRK